MNRAWVLNNQGWEKHSCIALRDSRAQGWVDKLLFTGPLFPLGLQTSLAPQGTAPVHARDLLASARRVSQELPKFCVINQFKESYWWLNCGHSLKLYLDWVGNLKEWLIWADQLLWAGILLVPSLSTAWSHSLTQHWIQNSSGQYKQVVWKVFLPSSITDSKGLGDVSGWSIF